MAENKKKTSKPKSVAKEEETPKKPVSFDEMIDENSESSENESTISERAEEAEKSLISDLKDATEKRGTRTSILVLAVIVSLVTGAVGGIFGTAYVAPYLGLPSGQGTNTQTRVVLDEGEAIVKVVEDVNNAVVSIIVTKDLPKYDEFLFNPFGDQDFFFSPFTFDGTGETQPTEVAAGSGFLVSADGIIVTNKHVVDETEAAYTVITADGKRHDAKVLAIDPLNDLAVIDIDGEDYDYLQFGDSDEIKLGQRVIAIGNSLGEFANSVTTGVVSGIGRTIQAGNQLGSVEQLDEIIQTDAAINPGNSGGPLLNLAGQVIGVNTAIDQSGQLVGFAIPSDEAKKALDDVLAHGKILRPYIGIRYILLNDEIAKANDISVVRGAWIVTGQEGKDSAIEPGSPAEKAGLLDGDVILAINGRNIDENNSLLKLLRDFEPGQTVVFKVWREGQESDILLTLGEKE